MKFKSSIINILVGVILVYLIFGLFLFFNQKSILYYPNNQDFENCDGFDDYEKINFKGTRFYYKQGSLDDVIIYYHGNAGSACDRSYFRSVFEESDNSIIFVEYAGYSDDDRKPSKKLILQDVDNIYDFMSENSFENVIVYGRSIGSGAASYHTSLGNVDSLILVTTFSKLADVAKSRYTIYPASIMLGEKYDNIKWLENFEGNIIIIHGDSDSIIPHKFSQKLFDALTTEKKEYVLIEGKGHNNIWSSSFRNKIIE
ncbi:alpha/beta hydrolase, partial [bacterium]|nr:alpha/beta hydrolase [bacterium]